MKALLIGLVLLTATACGTFGIGTAPSPKTVTVTAESIAQLGQTYAVVAKVISADCNAKKSLTKQQCADFRAFGLKFKASYPVAKDLFLMAATSDARDIAIATIVQLTADLALFLALVGK